jgi:hypothetical protein
MGTPGFAPPLLLLAGFAGALPAQSLSFAMPEPAGASRADAHTTMACAPALVRCPPPKQA